MAEIRKFVVPSNPINRSYRRDQADGRFVNVTGDTMTGDLNINAALDVSGHAAIGGSASVSTRTLLVLKESSSGGAGDYMSVICPNPADANLANIGLTLKGTKV